MTAQTEAGDLPTVSTAPPALSAAAVVPGVAATVPSPAPASEPASAAAASGPDLAPPAAAAPTGTPAAGAGTGSSPGSEPAPDVESTVDEPVLVDPGPRPLARLRAMRGQGLTAPGGVVLAVLLLAPGVLVDWAVGGSFGVASTVTFVLAAVTTAVAVRIAAMGTAAVLPPLLFAGAVAVLAWCSGDNRGRREVALDVGTTLAVAAPTLFLGTAVALAVVLGRLAAHVLRR